MSGRLHISAKRSMSAPRRARTSISTRSPRRQEKPLLLRLEVERSGVEAVAKPGRARPVVEDVSEVTATLRAHHLRPPHPVAHVGVLGDLRRVERLSEAWPPRPRVEFRVRAEKRFAAPGTAIGACVLRRPVLPRECPLRALLAEDPVLLRDRKSVV